jgi:hypothetical protein
MPTHQPAERTNLPLATQLIRLLLAGALLVSLLLALAFTSSTSTSSVLAEVQQEERRLDDEIPKQVPLRAKIKKEKEKGFKDLKNEKWARELELEVTNIGDKPVYEFFLYLVFDVEDNSGQDKLAPVDFGRAELGDHRVRATAEDVPLKPGESCILKIHPGQLGAWEHSRESEPHPKKIRVVFQLLSFGDGTGYIGSDGTAVPRKPGQQSSVGPCAPRQIRGDPKALDWRLGKQNGRFEGLLTLDIPARFLPVSFFRKTAHGRSH